MKKVVPGIFGYPLLLENINKCKEELVRLLLKWKEENRDYYHFAVNRIIVITKNDMPEKERGAKTFCDIWGDDISSMICQDFNLEKVEDKRDLWAVQGTNEINQTIEKLLQIYTPEEDFGRNLTPEEFAQYHDDFMKLTHEINDVYAAEVLAHMMMEAKAPMPREIRDLAIIAIDRDDDIVGDGWAQPEKRTEAMAMFKKAILEYGMNNNPDDDVPSYPNSGLIQTLMNNNFNQH